MPESAINESVNGLLGSQSESQAMLYLSFLGSS